MAYEKVFSFFLQRSVLMKPRDLWIALVLVGALGLTGWVGARAGNALNGRPTAVGVADVQLVFESLKEKMQIEADLKTRLESLNTDEQNRKQELQELKSDLEILAPDTPAYDEKQNKLEQNAIELQAWRTFQTQKLNHERGLQIERLYRKMLDAIGRIGQQEGYDVILFKEKPADFRGAKPEALNTLIQVRKVLWSTDDLDMTDQVIQLMNNEFNNRTP